MSRHLLQRFAVWTAFAVALLFPLTASAAILPMCEVDAVTVMPRAPLPSPLAFAAAEEPASPCDEASNATATADDDGVDPKVAAFCDARGASAVAPQRIVAVNDGRIEAASACTRIDSPAQTVAPAPHDGLAVGSASALVDPAAMGEQAPIFPATSELLPAFLPVTDVDLAGIEQAVYHPPR